MKDGVELYHRVVGTGTRADGTTYEILEANFAPTKQGASGQPWAECVRCGNVLPQASMSKIGGQFFCSQFGCAQEKTK